MESCYLVPFQLCFQKSSELGGLCQFLQYIRLALVEFEPLGDLLVADLHGHAEVVLELLDASGDLAHLLLPPPLGADAPQLPQKLLLLLDQQ